MNSLKFSFEFSPLGVLKLLAKQERAAFAKGDVKAISRATVGSLGLADASTDDRQVSLGLATAVKSRSLASPRRRKLTASTSDVARRTVIYGHGPWFLNPCHLNQKQPPQKALPN